MDEGLDDRWEDEPSVIGSGQPLHSRAPSRVILVTARAGIVMTPET